MPAAAPPPTGATTASPGRRRRLPLRPAGGFRPGGLRRRARTSLDQGDTAAVSEHLGELRRRVIVVTAAFLSCFIAAYVLRDHLFALLNRPLGGRYEIQTLAVTEPFFASLTVAANAAFMVVVPLVAWHAWRFVAPAMAPAARRSTCSLVVLAPALFFSGVAFCYLFVLGPAVRFLLGLGEEGFNVTVRAQEYYAFVTMTMLGMGLAFLFPLVLLGLARVGLVTSERLRGNRRIALVLMVVVAALLPTADPVSLAVEVLPLLGLYELSVLLVRMQERATERREAADDEAAAADRATTRA